MRNNWVLLLLLNLLLICFNLAQIQLVHNGLLLRLLLTFKAFILVIFLSLIKFDYIFLSRFPAFLREILSR